MSGKKEKVRTYYDNFSNDYDRFYEKIQFEKYSYVFNRCNLHSYESLIDVGGGTGLLSKYFGKEILTIDISYEMIKRALEHTNLLLVADMSSLPIRKSSFEMALSFTAIQNAHSPLQVINEIARILWNDLGKFIITTLEKILDQDKFKLLCETGGFIGDITTLPIEDVAYSNVFKIK